MAGINFKEIRGIRDLVFAELLTDTKEAITYDTPFAFAGIREVSGETNESTASSFYDNASRIVKTAEGEDTYGLITSVPEDSVKAKTEGRVYKEEKGHFIATPKNSPYMAMGFVAKHTDGKEYGYWIMKGKLTGGNETIITEDDGTESNGLEYSYASVYTNHVFTEAENKPVKFHKVDLSLVDEETFFSKVTTPDEVVVAG